MDGVERNRLRAAAGGDQPHHPRRRSCPVLVVFSLAANLLTFVIAFSGERALQQAPVRRFLVFVLIAFALVVGHYRANIIWQVGFYLTALFVACMAMHGELYRLRPEPSHLTRFYLTVSVGGVAGGILVTIVAPAVFSGNWELYFGWAMAWVLLAVLTFVRKTTEVPERWRFRHDVAVGAMALTAVILAGQIVASLSSGGLVRERNFYGVLRVKRLDDLRSERHGARRHAARNAVLRPGIASYADQLLLEGKRHWTCVDASSASRKRDASRGAGPGSGNTRGLWRAW